MSFALFVKHRLDLQDEEGSVIFPPEVGVAHCGSNSCSSSCSSSSSNSSVFLVVVVVGLWGIKFDGRVVVGG